jgi:hypothetical protein
MEKRMNWLMVVVVVILAGNALIGRKVGLIRMVFSLCSMVVALLLTIIMNPLVNSWMVKNGNFYESVANKIEVILEGKEAGDENIERGEDSKVVDKIKEQMDSEKITKKEEASYIEKLQLPKSLKKSLQENNTISTYKSMAIDNFKQYISRYLAGVVVKALSFVVTFIIILVILWILSFSLNLISKLPILNQINKTTGAFAGLLHGLILVWIFFLVMTVFGGTIFGQNILGMIESSKMLSFIYNNNFLLRFITGVPGLVL